MKVNIFGTEYKVYVLKNPNKTMIDNLYDGYCNFDDKEIYLLQKEDINNVYLHEIIHCYLFESGHKSMGTNEYVVELISEIVSRAVTNVVEFSEYKKKKRGKQK